MCLQVHALCIQYWCLLASPSWLDDVLSAVGVDMHMYYEKYIYSTCSVYAHVQ